MYACARPPPPRRPFLPRSQYRTCPLVIVGFLQIHPSHRFRYQFQRNLPYQVAVQGEGGWILHAGDAYFSHQEVLDPPSCPKVLAMFQRLLTTDNAARLETQRLLRALAGNQDMRVRMYCSHDSQEFTTFAQENPDRRYDRAQT